MTAKRAAGWTTGALALGVALILGGLGGCGATAKTVEPKTEDEKTLYALGMTLGQRITPFKLSAAELEMVKQGMADAATGAKEIIDLKAYGPKIGEMYQARVAQQAGAAKEGAKAFLEKAAKEPGAQVQPSGLIYTEITKGKGPSPQPTDQVTVNYKGTLTDGTEFDSSYKRNEPATFPLNGVIKCWTEGVGKMAVGGKSKLVCPSDIAYGDNGRAPVIPPGATLVFEVELLSIGNPPAAK
jgi:FKBP-type peptidyl-prolyl cis-trans isomerase FkpA